MKLFNKLKKDLELNTLQLLLVIVIILIISFNILF
jgi:hypothetical protein